MSSKNRILSYVLFVIGVAILAGAVIYSLHIFRVETNTSPSDYPRTIASYPLSQVITGQEAITSIHQLHGKDFTLVDGAVVSYGDQNVILWVSDAGGQSAAADLTELMRARIAEGRSPFVDQGAFDQDGILIYALDGLGQDHFYWQSSSLVLWLAADYDIAASALGETVRFYAR